MSGAIDERFALVRRLVGQGHRVTALVRDAASAPPDSGILVHALGSGAPLALPADVDAVVHLAQSRSYRVFPGEGVHTSQIVQMVQALDAMGYAGDYSFEVCNDDYQQMPLPMVCERARRACGCGRASTSRSGMSR